MSASEGKRDSTPGQLSYLELGQLFWWQTGNARSFGGETPQSFGATFNYSIETVLVVCARNTTNNMTS